MTSRTVLFGAALIVALVCTSYAQTEITLLSPNPIEDAVNTLVADFEAKTGTHVAVTYGTGVSTRLGVAVKKGAPKPDISTADAVRRTLLNATSITASIPSGEAPVARRWRRWTSSGSPSS